MPTPGTGPQWACHSPAAQLTAGRGTTTATPTPAGFPTWCSFSSRCNATRDLRLHQLSHQKKSTHHFPQSFFGAAFPRLEGLPATAAAAVTNQPEPGWCAAK